MKMGKYYQFPSFTIQEFCDYVNNNAVFVSRIGGSDYNAIYQYQLYKNGKNSEYNFNLFNNICSNYNGYFDKEENKDIRHQNFIKYLDLLYEIYKKQKMSTPFFVIRGMIIHDCLCDHIVFKYITI